jgi:hypothetical protein
VKIGVTNIQAAAYNDACMDFSDLKTIENIKNLEYKICMQLWNQNQVVLSKKRHYS